MYMKAENKSDKLITVVSVTFSGCGTSEFLEAPAKAHHGVHSSTSTPNIQDAETIAR